MPRVAAIDCGTNSIRLLIADVDDGVLRDVHREMRVVRLGQGVDATGELAPEAIERTRAALVDYAERVRSTGSSAVRMVATSAPRDARNREDFFAMVRDVLGLDAEVISGDEEARLSFVGAVGDLGSGGPYVVADVGGGSTELVVGEWASSGPRVRDARSVDVGCVRLTERCLAESTSRGEAPSAAEIENAERVVRETLDEVFEVVDVSGARTWVGVAGTVTTLSAVAMELPEYDPAAIHLSRLGLDELRAVTGRLLGMTHDERAALGAMHPGRVDVICGGALVVRVLAEELHERAGIDELAVSEHDILDGLALSLVDGRLSSADQRFADPAAAGQPTGAEC